jgi:RHS repeat-associated protein
MVDESGQAVSEVVYYPFGLTRYEQSGDQVRYRFTDKELDITGLYYYEARYYDALVGRFISVDPLYEDTNNKQSKNGPHNPQRLNTYSYVLNNPIVYVDPDGLEETRTVWDNISDFSAGFGDTITFGATSAWRRATDSDYVNRSSAAYIAGEVAGFVFPLGAVVRGARLLNVGRGVKAANAVGSTGKLGEIALKRLVGGISQRSFPTSLGRRVIDQLSRGIAHESKVGYTTLTRQVQQQIAKDAELIASGRIKGATWHFFRSPQTGRIGLSDPLRRALREAGIKIKEHNIIRLSR